MKYITSNESETEDIAAAFADTVNIGGIICLCGELGAGKTVFARGFARGLGIDGRITSPTFCIVNEYSHGRLPLYHFDMYRVGAADMEDIGFEDYLYGDGICLIEWAEQVRELIPAHACWIQIAIPTHNHNQREITICRRLEDGTKGIEGAL